MLAMFIFFIQLILLGFFDLLFFLVFAPEVMLFLNLLLRLLSLLVFLLLLN